ncbi:MAG: hypothetical protein IJI57_06355 [Flexilinea sp.]|nr:hypothetical protein [Flexilinea sp.]
MENKNQNKYYANEESINAFVKEHVRKSQREKAAAILRWLNGKKLWDVFNGVYDEAYEKERAAM